MDLGAFDLRDAVLLVAVCFGIYLALMLLRLFQLGKRRKAPFEVHATPPRLDPDFAVPSAPTFVAPPPETAPAPPPRSDETPRLKHLEQELAALREEVAALRGELAELQVSRRVSPQYADAMALARRGYDAHGIADRCGIALGEAELVSALARGTPDFEAEDDYGDNRREPYAAR